MKISLSMILKNEGKTVKEVIRKVLPIIDEAVIGIDEKTVDNTREQVLEAFEGSNVPYNIIDFTFNDNFAEIRNRFIDCCTGDYVLVLDGHDFISPESLLQFQQFKKEDKTFYDVVDVNIVEESPTGETWFQQPRLFKPFIKYEFAIHNTITHMDKRITMPHVIIYHRQPMERYIARKEQRKKINYEGLIEKANAGDVRSMYYLATNFYEHSDWQSAIDWYQKYLKKSKHVSEKYQARLYLSTCYRNLDNIDGVKQTLLDCEADGEMRNEHLIGLGDYYFDHEQDYLKALYYYRKASSVEMPIQFLILEKSYYTYVPWVKIATAYLALGYVDGVMDACKKGKTIAPQLDIWENVEKKVMAKIELGERQKNGLIYFVASGSEFIRPIIDHLGKIYAVRLEDKFVPDHAISTSMIWCEWGDYNAIAISNFKTDAVKVLRIHSYEVFSDFINHIDFTGFDVILFVADHIKNYFLHRTSVNGKLTVIPNFVDLNLYNLPEKKEKNNKIAWAGYMANKKAPTVILMLANDFPDYEFHVAAEFQESDIEHLFKEHKTDNIFLYSWQSDLNKFFSDKSYVLNTSPRESQSMSVMQGMACGCKPLIYNWVGAEDIYNKDWVFNGIEDFSKMLKGEWDAGKYRKFIENYYSKDKILPKITDLIQRLIKEKKNEVTI